jgi:hypothetical protein
MNPVETIKAFTPDPTKFRQHGRGYVDWRFGQVAEYLGYEGAIEYVATMRRWHDFKKFEDCTLNQTFIAFQEAEKEINYDHATI